jgi:hypothetical protein
VGSKHKRTWTVIREGVQMPSGYRTSLVKLDSENAVAVGINALFSFLDWVTGPSDLTVAGFAPRYRVLVGRAGTEEVVGVRQARTHRKACQQLAEVEDIVANSTGAGVQGILGLDF